MTDRVALLLAAAFSLLAAPVWGSAGPPEAVAQPELPSEAVVVAVAVDRVYLGLGTDDGLRPGCRVQLPGGSASKAVLIDALSRHRASFRSRGQRRTLRVGDALPILPPLAEAPRRTDEHSGHAAVGPREDAESLYSSTLGRPGPAPKLVVAREDRGKGRSSGGLRAGAEKLWRGSVGLMALGVFDQSASDLDLYRLRLSSRIRGDGLLGGHLFYRHRLAAQGFFGPRISDRIGSSSRRWIRVDHLEAGYASGPDGGVQAALGRLPAPGSLLSGPTDGGRVAWEGPWASAQIVAGVAARPDDLMIDTGTLRAAVDLSIFGDVGPVEGRGDLSLQVSRTGAQMDRSSLGLALSGRVDRWIDLFAYGELGWLPADLRSPGDAAATFDRVHVSASTRPHDLVRVRASYSLDRPVLDRQLLERLPRGYLRRDLRQVWSVSVRAGERRYSAEAHGGMDLSPETGVRWQAGLRLGLRGLPWKGARWSLSGQRNGTAFFDRWTLGAGVRQQLGGDLDVALHYLGSLSDDRALEETSLLHGVDASVDWSLDLHWSLSVEASYLRGATEDQVSTLVYVFYGL